MVLLWSDRKPGPRVSPHFQVSILQQPAFCVVRSLIAFRLTSTHKDYCVVGTDAGKVTILEYLPETSEVSTSIAALPCHVPHKIAPLVIVFVIFKSILARSVILCGGWYLR